MAGFNTLTSNTLTLEHVYSEHGRIAREPDTRQSKKLMSSIKEIYSGMMKKRTLLNAEALPGQHA